MNSLIKNSINTLSKTSYIWYPNGFPEKVFGYQALRWKKPRWLPRAPSKMYIITHRKRLPPDETRELLRLYQNFKCYMRMSIEHCIKENKIQAETGQLSQIVLEQEEEEHQQLMEYNRLENERLAKLRKERREKEEEELIAQIIREKEAASEMSKLHTETKLEKLSEIEALVSTFIGLDDLDEAIETAMNNPTDYNFAIDEDGNIYEGRFTTPHKVEIDSLRQFPIKDVGLTNVF